MKWGCSITSTNLITINQEELNKFVEDVHYEFVNSDSFLQDELEEYWNKHDIASFVRDCPITLASLNKVGRVNTIKTYVNNRASDEIISR